MEEAGQIKFIQDNQEAWKEQWLESLPETWNAWLLFKDPSRIKSVPIATTP